MAKKREIRNSTAKFLIFQAENKEQGIEVMYANETIWCTQDAIAALFDKGRSTIAEHLQNAFTTGELERDSVCRKFRRTAADGKEYNTQYYNLDAIISVGYRANSIRATQFRQWATSVLRQYAIVLRTGEVRVSPYLPFGGDDCSLIKASGITTPKSKWIWLPVFSFLIEHPKGLVLFDTGWHREMSPDGVYDKRAQIKSLGSWFLYQINQGRIAEGEAIDEQLAKLNHKTSDIDYVLLSHLDCDHANGLRLVKDAKHILVSEAEMIGTTRKNLQIKIRFQKRWWEGVDLKTFDWNGTEGPVGKSYDVLGDGSLVMVNIPGHSEGLCALKIRNAEGKYVLLFADGGYATKSWRDMITSGITLDKQMQRRSLQWIREQSLSPDCVESVATHDTDVEPHVIEL